MKKIVIAVVALMFCSSAAVAETCRIVKKASREGVFSATFACATDEKIGFVTECRDDLGSSFVQTIASQRAVRCVNIWAEDYASEGYFCDEDVKDDLSCIPPIKLDYTCCK